MAVQNVEKVTTEVEKMRLEQMSDPSDAPVTSPKDERVPSFAVQNVEKVTNNVQTI